MADARLQAAGRKPGRRTWALGAVLVLAALACERAFVPRPEAGADAGHLSAQARRALVMLALAPTPAVAARNQMPACACAI
ncbi:unnamed protein product [Effrenium voratum]|nr:unnamed protein product [Effrenium voratum]